MTRGLLANERGSVLVEYIIVTALALTLVLALTAIAPAIVRAYSAQQQSLYQPNP